MLPVDFEFAQRHLALDTPECTVELDEWRRASDGDQRLVAHIRVHRWSPSALKKMRREWALFRTLVTLPIFASPIPHEGPELKRWVRFVGLMGFRPLTTVLCEDGHTRPLYIHANGGTEEDVSA